MRSPDCDTGSDDGERCEPSSLPVRFAGDNRMQISVLQSGGIGREHGAKDDIFGLKYHTFQRVPIVKHIFYVPSNPLYSRGQV